VLGLFFAYCCPCAIITWICYAKRCCCFKNVPRTKHVHVPVTKKVRKRRRVKRDDGHSSSESYSGSGSDKKKKSKDSDHEHHHGHHGHHNMGHVHPQGGHHGGQGGPQGDVLGRACFCALAHTPHGAIPGLVYQDDQSTCWYAYGGQEFSTHEFEIIYSSWISDVTEDAAQGHQNGEEYWCCIVNTVHGKVPGKAAGGACWYAMQGQEVQGHDGFLYVNGR